MASSKDLKGRVLTDGERAELVKFMNSDGMAKVSDESGSSELALSKAAAGIAAQRGTIALIRNYLAPKTTVAAPPAAKNAAK